MILQIDTQKVYSALVAGGFSAKQADTVIETMRAIDLSHLATKEDIKDLRQEMKDMESSIKLLFIERLSKVEADNIIIKWMMGFVLAGILSLVLKSYF